MTATKSKEYGDLARKVIRDHDDLHWIRQTRVRIGYAEADHEKKEVDMSVSRATVICMLFRMTLKILTGS